MIRLAVLSRIMVCPYILSHNRLGFVVEPVHKHNAKRKEVN